MNNSKSDDEPLSDFPVPVFTQDQLSRFPPGPIRQLLESWSPEIEASVLDHAAAAKFFKELDALIAKLRFEESLDRATQLKESINKLRRILRQTVGLHESLSATLSQSERRQGADVDVDGSREILIAFANRLLYAREVDKHRKRRHGKEYEGSEKTVQDDDDKNQKQDSLRSIFQQTTSADYADLTAATLNQIKQQIDEAELIQARRLIGLADNEAISVEAVNRFLQGNAGQDLSAENKDRLSRLISHLRASGIRLQMVVQGEWRDCSITSMFRRDRGTHLLKIREAGGERTELWRRPTLPEGLRIK
ncbi:hypothetical protein [Lignipirellula cremea]|uniref:Uncharacterized protein n=1 Tax=Lignipirellula cremea TaxID=2528010 RepID=A0A518E3E9_9BACT|nr:hypothetical protein [Lignipirellula cremea]QDU98617.1 hypothetical protein Pla8534_64880 [Lignipirellula cremea]